LRASHVRMLHIVHFFYSFTLNIRLFNHLKFTWFNMSLNVCVWTGSKIIFTNGSQDPWRRASKQTSSTDRELPFIFSVSLVSNILYPCHHCGNMSNLHFSRILHGLLIWWLSFDKWMTDFLSTITKYCVQLLVRFMVHNLKFWLSIPKLLITVDTALFWHRNHYS